MINRITSVKTPAVLYKYRDWNQSNHRKIITNREIYLSNPSDFNDPFDCFNPIRGDQITLEECFHQNLEIVKSFFPDDDEETHIKKAQKITDEKSLWHPDVTIKESVERLDKWNNIIGIFSLTESKNNILMWSHYSNNHTGFVVGFDTKFLITEHDFDFIEPIIYQEEYPVIKGIEGTDNVFHKKFFYKSNLWNYELEWRISKNHIQNRKIRLKEQSIKEVIIGCRTPLNIKSEIIRKVQNHLKNVEIFEARKMESFFGLDIVKIV